MKNQKDSTKVTKKHGVLKKSHDLLERIRVILDKVCDSDLSLEDKKRYQNVIELYQLMLEMRIKQRDEGELSERGFRMLLGKETKYAAETLDKLPAL